jgi:hypothetical protein
VVAVAEFQRGGLTSLLQSSKLLQLPEEIGLIRDHSASAEDEFALDGFIRRFEAQTLPKAEWTHAAHLRIGGCYVLAHGQAEALVKLRVGIRRLNESHGVINSDTSGYHETLTCFWLAVIGRFLREYCGAHPDAKPVEAVETMVDTFAHRSGMFKEYWSIDVVRSVEARKSWIAPDRLTLDIDSIRPALLYYMG